MLRRIPLGGGLVRSLVGVFFVAVTQWGLGGCTPDGSRWEAGCSSGDLAACVSLGTTLSVSEAQDDRNRAATLFERACEGGQAHGCRMLGVAYAKGDGVAVDGQKAQMLFRRACTEGDVIACQKRCNAGDAVMCLTVAARASRGGMDAHRAAFYFERACIAGHPLGCEELASMLAHDSYAEVKMTRSEAIARARQLRATACSGSNRPSFCTL